MQECFKPENLWYIVTFTKIGLFYVDASNLRYDYWFSPYSVDFVEHDTILRIILKYEFLYIING